MFAFIGSYKKQGHSMKCVLFLVKFVISWSVLSGTNWVKLFSASFCVVLFIYLSIYYLLKLYLPLLHKIAFANKFQLYHKIKYNIYYISLHIKHPQSISPIFLILFLNSNNELLDFTTAGRLFHIREPRKWIAFVP